MQGLFTIVPVLLTASIAIASWYIARWQASISEEKLRLELYEKRFDIYSKAVDFLQALMEWNGSEKNRTTHRLFVKAKLESAFLFAGSDIPEMMEKMHIDAFKLMGLKEHGKDLAGDPTSFLDFYNKGMEGLNSFAHGVDELQSKMAPYLNFDLLRRK